MNYLYFWGSNYEAFQSIEIVLVGVFYGKESFLIIWIQYVYPKKSFLVGNNAHKLISIINIDPLHRHSIGMVIWGASVIILSVLGLFSVRLFSVCLYCFIASFFSSPCSQQWTYFINRGVQITILIFWIL